MEGKITNSAIYISSFTDSETKELKEIKINGKELNPNDFDNDFLDKLQYLVCDCLLDRNYKLMKRINGNLSKLKIYGK